MKFGIVIEKAENNYSAYVPDLPGCIATGRTLQEVRDLLKEGIELHIEAMLQDGENIPAPTTLCDYIAVAVPQLH
jgi:predicted RNase H-like HicB family nuclease